jgi:hypothetical protein
LHCADEVEGGGEQVAGFLVLVGMLAAVRGIGMGQQDASKSVPGRLRPTGWKTGKTTTRSVRACY